MRRLSGSAWLLAATAVLALAWAILLTRGRTIVAFGDALQQTWPWWQSLMAATARGQIPLFDGHLSGGMSAVGEGQAFIFYPPALIVGILRFPGRYTLTGLELFAFAHALLGLLGTYALLRALDMRKSASAAGALVFALGGPFAYRAWGQLNIFDAFAWVPLGLALTVMAIRRRKATFAVLSGLCMAMSLYAGHTDPLTLGLGAIFVLYAAAWRWPLAPQDEPIGPKSAIVGVTTTFACFLGFAAPQLFVMIYYAREAVRFVGLPYPIAGTANLSPAQLALNPHLEFHELANFAILNAASPADTSAYLGTTCLVLVGAGVFSRRRGITVWTLLAALGFILAFGTTTRLLTVLVTIIPPISQFREPSRYLMLVQLAVPVLAAAAVDEATKSRPGEWARRLQGVAAGLAGVAVPVIIVLVVPLAGPVPTRDIVIALVFAVLTALVLLIPGRLSTRAKWSAIPLVLLLSVQMVAAFHKSVPRVNGPADAAIETTWQNSDVEKASAFLHRVMATSSDLGERVLTLSPLIPRNWGAVSGISTTSSYSATLMTDFYRLMPLGLIPPGAAGQLMATKYILADPQQHLSLPVVTRIGSLTVYQAPNATPSAWIVTTVCRAGSTTATANLTGWDPAQIRSVALIEGPGDTSSSSQKCSTVDRPSRGATATILSWKASGQITIRVHSHRNAFLVISSNWSRSWHATIDGHAAPRPLLTDTDDLGIPIPAGDHVVKLQYWPQGLDLGLLLALITTLTVLVFSVASASKHRSRPRTPHGSAT